MNADGKELAALAERLGADAQATRLGLEAGLRERAGQGQGRGFFRFEHRVDLNRIIRFCLRVGLLWGRARRNYFDLRVETNAVFLERLPQPLDGLRLLHLSDLHADLHPEFPANLIRTVAPLDYDLVVLTGDYRTCTYRDPSGATQATLEIVRHLRAPVFAVLGNHDSLAKVPPMEAAGVRFLLNENVCFERAGGCLYLVGIDDPNFYGTGDLDRALSGVPSEACKILLSHAPQTYADAASRGVDLVLSGHTHGGQICLPGGGIVVHDGTAPRKVLSGAWREGGTQGYTSRGAGATGLPARLNCPPEVTVHTLRRRAS